MAMTDFSKITLESIIEEAKAQKSVAVSDESKREIADFLDKCEYQRTNERLFNGLCWLGGSEIERSTCRGLLLRGTPGIGKTYGMKLLAQKFGWMFVTAQDVEAFYKTEPSQEQWEDFCRALNFHNEPKTLVIDDLGVEAFPFVHYGKPGNPLAELLEIRYRISFLRDKVRTIVTSNLSEVDLKTRYGYRLCDRFKEMFYNIAIDGESMRKTA